MKRISILNLSIIVLILFSTNFIYLQESKEQSEYKLAINLYNDGMYELALQQFKNFINSYPSSPQNIEARFYTGLCLMKLEKYEDAKYVFQNFALTYSEHPRAAEAWFKVGESLVKLENYNEAAVFFERARTFHPKSQIAPEALLMASKYYRISGDNLKAKKSLTTILQEYSNSEFIFNARLLLAEIYSEEGNFDLAVSETKKVEDYSEKYKPEALLLLAKIYKSYFQYADAEKLLIKIIQNYPNNNNIIEEAKFELGLIYKQNKQYSKSISQFLDLVNKQITDSVKFEYTIFELANTYLELKEYKNALDNFQKLSKAEHSKYLPEALYWSGYCSEQLNDFKSALIYYDKIIKLNLNNNLTSRAYIRASFTAEKLGNIHLAINYCENFIKSSNTSYGKQEALLRIAELYKNRLKDYDKAINSFDSALKFTEQKHNLCKILLNIAECKELSGNYKDALETYDYLIQNYPPAIETRIAGIRSEFLKNYKQKNYENAISKLTQIFSKYLTGDKKQLQYELGQIYFEDLKDYLLAANSFADAVSKTNSNELNADALFKMSLAYDRYSIFDSSYKENARKGYIEILDKYPDYSKLEEVVLNLVKLYAANKQILEIESLVKKYFSAKSNNRYYFATISLLADLYLENNKFLEASKLYKTIITSNDNKLVEYAYWKAAEIYKNQNNIDSTIVILNKQLNLFPRGNYAALATYELAKLYIEQKKYSEGIKYLKQIINSYYYTELDNNIEETYLNTLIESGDYSESLILIQKLNQNLSENPFSEPDTLKYKFFIAKIYYKLGDLKKASLYLRQYLINPTNPELTIEAYLTLGEISRTQGMPDAATIYYQAAGSLGSQKASRDVADLLFKQGRYYDAISNYQNLLKNADKLEDKQYYQAQIILAKLKNNEIQSALLQINEFKKQYPKSKQYLAEFEYERALAYFRNKDYNNAKKTFQDVSSDYDDTIYKSLSEFYLGKILEINGQIQDATKKYQTIITRYPKTEAAYRSLLALGNIHFNSEKYEEAIKYYQDIVADKDRAGEILQYALTNLIEAYESVKLYDAALRITRDYISSYPDDKSLPDKKIKLGILYTRLGYYDQAILQFTTLLDELGPDYEAEIRYNLGETYYYKGDYQQAILEFLKIPYLTPTKQDIDWSATALYMAGQSYERLGRYEQAISIYQQIIDRKNIDLKFKAGAQKEIDRVKSLIKKGD